MGDGAQKSPAGAGLRAVYEYCRVAAAPYPTYRFGGLVNCLTQAAR